MTAQHKTLTASQIHVSKGIAAASANFFNLVDTGANNWVALHYSEPVTATTSSNISFDDLADFREIILTFDDIVGSTSQNLSLQFSSDNGSSYQETLYHSTWNTDGTSASSSDHTGIILSKSADTRYISGKIIITNFNKALVSTVKGQLGRNASASYAGSANSMNLLGCNTSATIWNTLKITPSTGTISSGVVTLEGLRA